MRLLEKFKFHYVAHTMFLLNCATEQKAQATYDKHTAWVKNKLVLFYAFEVWGMLLQHNWTHDD